MTTTTKIASITFDAHVVREYSATPNVQQLGEHRCTMDLYFGTDDHGCIEWDIQSLEETAEIGLTFEIGPKGERNLIDYDGIFELPPEAVDLLRQNGVAVCNSYDRRVRLQFGNSPPVDLNEIRTELTRLQEWVEWAQVGDSYQPTPDTPAITRVA